MSANFWKYGREATSVTEVGEREVASTVWVHIIDDSLLDSEAYATVVDIKGNDEITLFLPLATL